MINNVNNVTKEDFIKEYKNCALNVIHDALYSKVEDKETEKWVNFKVFPHQEQVINALEEHKEVLVSKYRQAGITTLINFFLSNKINYIPDTKVAFIANNLSTARKNLKQTYDFIKNKPDFLRTGMGEKNDKGHKIFENRSECQAFAANEDGVRGFSPNYIFIDEAAFLENGDEFWKTAIGSLSAGGKVIMVSTPNGLDATYYQTYKNALEGNNNFKVVTLNWYDDPRFNKDLIWYKGDEILRNVNPERHEELIQNGYKPWSTWFGEQCKKYNNDSKKIAQELENNFLGSGGNMITTDHIQRHENSYVKDPISEEGDNKDIWIFKEYDKSKNNIMGLDISTGSGNDYSTMNILEYDENGIFDQVVEIMAKVPPEILAEMAFLYGKKYGFPKIVADVTNGSTGLPCVKQLLDMGYPNIHYSAIKNANHQNYLNDYLKEDGDGKTLVPGIELRQTNRELILDNFKQIIQKDLFLTRSVRLINEYKTFVWDEKKKRYDHTRSTHDDLIFSCAMPTYVISMGGGLGYDKEKTEAMLQAWQVNTKNNHEDRLRRKFNNQNKNNNGGKFGPCVIVK